MKPELADYMERFRATAAEMFATTAYQSILLGVSQYWADEADDAVHDTMIASQRTLPLWPHRCAASTYDEGVTPIEGEACSSCGIGFPEWLEWWHSNGDAVSAFEAWCHEAGNQESPEIENAMPCLVARRGANGVELSFIGKLERLPSLLFTQPGDTDDHGKPERLPSLLFRQPPDDNEDRQDLEATLELEATPAAPLGDPDSAWADARALQLLEQVAAHPHEDGPRRVLADYLLERDEPRGELIATALDAATNPRAKARYDELFRDKFATWFHPLAQVSPDATAVFDRGFLVACDLEVGEDQASLVRGAPVLRTVEKLRVHGGVCVLDPSMRALRRLGAIDEEWLDVLVAAPAWAIEHLEVVLNDERAIELLRDARNLPALRELWLSGELCEQAARELPKAAWWPQLERLAVADRDIDGAGSWQKRHHELGVPWLAIQQAYTDPTDALGWELAFGPDGACEATLRGFSPHATFAELAKMVAHVVPFEPTLVASDYYAPASSDLTLLRNA